MSRPINRSLEREADSFRRGWRSGDQQDCPCEPRQSDQPSRPAPARMGLVQPKRPAPTTDQHPGPGTRQMSNPIRPIFKGFAMCSNRWRGERQHEVKHFGGLRQAILRRGHDQIEPGRRRARTPDMNQLGAPGRGLADITRHRKCSGARRPSTRSGPGGAIMARAPWGRNVLSVAPDTPLGIGERRLKPNGLAITRPPHAADPARNR